MVGRTGPTPHGPNTSKVICGSSSGSTDQIGHRVAHLGPMVKNTDSPKLPAFPCYRSGSPNSEAEKGVLKSKQKCCGQQPFATVTSIQGNRLGHLQISDLIAKQNHITKLS
eukprot:TRINITY_DN19448_c0_g1_i2.p1 TRINITY_DN19448_c0_g1~~TRINITY_DN19448_c0_g1_i2.p1  ORF type:complete len:111 (-),score=9.23 TRINITY_DN19448_c0_g1_i2:263-595(-)